MELPVFQHIKLFENVLTQKELEECDSYLFRPKWERTNSNQALGDSLLWRMNLKEDSFFTKKIFNKIKKITKMNFEIFDVYANGSTTSMASFPHIDARENGVHIFLLYMNPEWCVEWGGQTLFLNKYFDVEEENEIGTNDTVSFLPRFNCALFFPGNIVHMSEAPSREFRGLRTTVAFRLREI